MNSVEEAKRETADGARNIDASPVTEVVTRIASGAPSIVADPVIEFETGTANGVPRIGVACEGASRKRMVREPRLLALFLDPGMSLTRWYQWRARNRSTPVRLRCAQVSIHLLGVRPDRERTPFRLLQRPQVPHTKLHSVPTA